MTASTHEGSLGANGTTTYTGTSSLNPDGTGAINLKFRDGQIAYERIATGGEPSGPTFSFVMTDGGSQLLLLRTDGNATFDSVFGTAQLQ